ncbi:amino acid adenylation domain-containing protein [Streptomyces sp. NPDC047000]|uniref:amino acid adenylation domain-containing protein n=1 Tax=Streptomyces sp. NPDC047000 TaxID=3155474 RepID=UPI0033D8AF17
MLASGVPFPSLVRNRPTAAAVRCGGRTITRQELDERVGALARTIGAGQVVAVRSDDRIDYVTGLLAALRADAVHLPLDPAGPGERAESLLDDVGATLVLADGRLHGRTCGHGTRGRLTGGGYVIHTSGTTGTPKGVLVAWHTLLAHLGTAVRRFGLTEDDVVLHFARPTVDVAIEQVLAGVLAGACLVVPERQLPAAEELLDLLDTEGVTVANLPAGYFREVVGALRGQPPRRLRLMISGSDRLHSATAARWRERTGVPLLNAYGPTETTITATVADLSEATDATSGTDDGVAPIGSALGPRELYVLDERLRSCPPGTVGELFIGGPLQALGYWGRPASTAHRFPADPFSREPGARMYRTGDLVRWTADGGMLEFVGRTDDQVKIRGFRVEPGEAENALAAHPGVSACAVVVRDGALAAYATGSAPPDLVAAREFLASRLPDHLLPTSLTVLDALPLTPTGVIDRAALPAPSGPLRARRGRQAPGTPAEQLVAAVWSDVLGLTDIDVRDNFFELGGDSLTAVRVVSRVADVFGAVSPYTIFEAPTLAEFAAALGSPVDQEGPVLTASGLSEAPLSRFQWGLWFLEQWQPGSATYNVPWVFRFAGPVDTGLLRAALETVVARHDVLRTVFRLRGDVPRQVVLDRIDLPFRVTEVPSAGVDDLIAATAREPFDLAAGPLLRAHLLRVPDGETVLVLLVHHIVWDEASLSVLESELREAYAARREQRPHRLPRLPVQYTDFSLWQERTGTSSRELDYWRDQLRDPPQEPALPTDHPRPEVQAFRGACHGFAMTPPLTRAVREFARRAGATPFMVLLAGLALALHRRSGESDLVIGSPTSVRGRPELASLIGYFVNLLPLRLRVNDDTPFGELVRQVREVLTGAHRHRDVPFHDIADLVLDERPANHNPLCQVLLELHTLETRPLDLDGTPVSRALYSNDVSRFDLSISVDDRTTDFTGRFEYDSDLFDEATIANLCESWLGTLASAVGAPLHTLFEVQAARRPDATALIHDGERLSYAELNARADRLAGILAERGVGRGAVLAVLMDRGFDLVVALLAALKAGAGYTLLDPGLPAARLAGVVTAGAAGLVLTHGHRTPPFTAPNHLDLDDLADAPMRHSALGPRPPVTADDLACVMFTSGSTGRPKAVAVSHRALTATYLGQDYARFGPSEVWLQCSPVAWDAFALELYGALLFGGTCVLHPGHRTDPQIIADLTARHGVTQLQLSASLFNFLIEEFPQTFAGLEGAFTAGERASVSHVSKVLSGFPDLRVGNGYGPVESLGFTTCHPVTEQDVSGGSIPVGLPVHGKGIHVLDTALRPVPPGVTGEVYVSGDGLAFGYTGQPGLTAGRFVASPHGGPGERFYRTGDLGRRTPDGVLEISGRTDDQVKIRGFRIEPGEIEDALTRHPHVREAAVAVFEAAPGDRRLAAYVTTGMPSLDPGAVLDHVARHLPEHLVPVTLDVLAALPRNANGKTDRRALPAPVLAGARPRQTALTETEGMVAAALCEVLGLPGAGAHDNFFRVGGSSLAAVRFAMRLSQLTGSRVPPQVVFRAKTVRAIAECLDDQATARKEDVR